MVMYARLANHADWMTLEALFYPEFVYENGEFKSPFQVSQPLVYLDCFMRAADQKRLISVTAEVIDFASRNSTVASMITDQIGFEEAWADGWFQM